MKKNKLNNKGMLIILSSPSGGGKTTIARELLRKDKNMIQSVSCTTRKPRAGEKNSRDYFFITNAKFKAMVKNNAFLEWASVHHHLYGTPRHWVEDQLWRSKDVLLVIDVQGGKTIKNKATDAILIFVKPPSFKVLKERLIGRQSDDAKALKIRLKDARKEIQAGKQYDYQIVNDRLPTAVSCIRKIIKNEREKRVKILINRKLQ
jgi:guanylate kinase